MATKVKDAAATAKPIAKRLAKDEKFKKNVKNAYGAARTVYDDLFFEGAEPTAAQARKIVARLAQDPELQEELRSVYDELRSAGKRAKKVAKPTHKGRNTLILSGILIGILYNPKTGPDTRAWLKERIFGPDDTFEFEA
ncbi:MAG: hypothetical protein U0R69_04990 [Gaiellales bacterium]